MESYNDFKRKTWDRSKSFTENNRDIAKMWKNIHAESSQRPVRAHPEEASSKKVHFPVLKSHHRTEEIFEKPQGDLELRLPDLKNKSSPPPRRGAHSPAMHHAVTDIPNMIADYQRHYAPSLATTVADARFGVRDSINLGSTSGNSIPSNRLREQYKNYQQSENMIFRGREEHDDTR